MARKARGTRFQLKERPTINNAMTAGFKPRGIVAHGPASDCKVTRADGTTYTIKAGRSKRSARKIAKVAAYAADTRNLDLLKMCGNIGNVE